MKTTKQTTGEKTGSKYVYWQLEKAKLTTGYQSTYLQYCTTLTSRTVQIVQNRKTGLENTSNENEKKTILQQMGTLHEISLY